MKKILILLFFGLLKQNLKCDTMHIYLNSFTCRACNLLGKDLEKFPEYYKILYLTNGDSLILDELLESYNFNKDTYNEIKFVQNDFFQTIQRHAMRSFYVVERFGLKLDTFILGDYSKLRNKEYNKEFGLKKIGLSKDIRFSNNSVITTTKDYILISDYKLNKAIVAKEVNDSILPIMAFDQNSFKINDFLSCACIDEKFYKSVAKELRESNTKLYQIENGYILDDVLNLMISFTNPQISQNGVDIELFQKTFIYSRNLKNFSTKMTCVNIDGLTETDNILSNKFHTTNFNFIKNSDTIYMPIVALDQKYKSLFVKQVIIDGKVKSLGLTKDLKSILPDDFDFNYQSLWDFNSRGFNNSCYYFLKNPLVYLPKEKKTIFVNNKLLIEDVRKRGNYISDVIFNTEKIVFIVQKDKKWFSEAYNSLTYDLIDKKIIDLPYTCDVIIHKSNFKEYLIYSFTTNSFYEMSIKN